jgi:hypothetical protein
VLIGRGSTEFSIYSIGVPVIQISTQIGKMKVLLSDVIQNKSDGNFASFTRLVCQTNVLNLFYMRKAMTYPGFEPGTFGFQVGNVTN